MRSDIECSKYFLLIIKLTRKINIYNLVYSSRLTKEPIKFPVGKIAEKLSVGVYF